MFDSLDITVESAFVLGTLVAGPLLCVALMLVMHGYKQALKPAQEKCKERKNNRLKTGVPSRKHRIENLYYLDGHSDFLLEIETATGYERAWVDCGYYIEGWGRIRTGPISISTNPREKVFILNGQHLNYTAIHIVTDVH